MGLFFARISRGRTIREFVLGAVIVPAIMYFVWFAFAGGTAISLEFSGVARGLINGATDGGKIFAMTDLMLGGGTLACLMALLIGGISAIQTAMVIGALPFSVVMVLMCISLIKAIYNDSWREAQGIEQVGTPPRRRRLPSNPGIGQGNGPAT